MGRDDTQRQDERQQSRRQQYHAVDTVEGLLGEQQAVEHVEDYDEYRYLSVINQKACHIYNLTIYNLLFAIGLYLVDEFAQIIHANLFFFDKRGDGTEVGVVEVVLDDTRDRRASILLL